MEQIIGFPLSMVVILVFSLMWLSIHPESIIAKGLAYLFGMMLTVSLGFLANIPVIGIFGDTCLPDIVFAATFAVALLLFLNGIGVLKKRLFFIFLGAVAIAVSICFVLFS